MMKRLCRANNNTSYNRQRKVSNNYFYAEAVKGSRFIGRGFNYISILIITDIFIKTFEFDVPIKSKQATLDLFYSF